MGGRIACYATTIPTKNDAKLVGLSGLEPPTSPLSGVRSNQLSYRPIISALFTTVLRYACRSLSRVPDVHSFAHSGARLAQRQKSLELILLKLARLELLRTTFCSLYIQSSNACERLPGLGYRLRR